MGASAHVLGVQRGVWLVGGRAGVYHGGGLWMLLYPYVSAFAGLWAPPSKGTGPI